jgi:hypothetical protein
MNTIQTHNLIKRRYSLYTILKKKMWCSISASCNNSCIFVFQYTHLSLQLENALCHLNSINSVSKIMAVLV